MRKRGKKIAETSYFFSNFCNFLSSACHVSWNCWISGESWCHVMVMWACMACTCFKFHSWFVKEVYFLPKQLSNRWILVNNANFGAFFLQRSNIVFTSIEIILKNDRTYSESRNLIIHFRIHLCEICCKSTMRDHDFPLNLPHFPFGDMFRVL